MRTPLKESSFDITRKASLKKVRKVYSRLFDVRSAYFSDFSLSLSLAANTSSI